MTEFQLKDLDPEDYQSMQSYIQTAETELNQKLVPPSLEEAFGEISINEVKEKYHLRFSLFLKAAGLLPEKHSQIDKKTKEARILGGLNNLDNYISNHLHDESQRTLKPTQFESFQKLRNFLEKGETEGYFKLPSGYGKTVLFIEFIEALNLKTLIVVPTQVLLGQTENKINQFASGVDVGTIRGMASNLGHDISIITYASFVNGVRKGTIKPEDYDCLILDEAHRSLSKLRIKTVKKFQNAIIIGFTATPKFNDEKHLSMLLQGEIDRIDVKEAIEDNLLSSCKVILARTNVDISEVRVMKNGEYHEGELNNSVNISSRNKAAGELYLKMFKGQKAIAYCVGVEHSKNVSEEFNNLGIPAGYIHGKMTPDQKKQVLEAHNTGKIKVICNADILIEGYDDTEITLCLNLRPTNSLVIAEQRGGRATRLNLLKPNKFATVVDFLDNTGHNSNSISYAEILGSAEVMNSNARKYQAIPSAESLQIEGLSIVTEPEKVMEIVGRKNYWHEIHKEESEILNNGWLTDKVASDLLGISKAHLAKFAQQYKKEYPELFFEKTYEDKFDQKNLLVKTYYRNNISELLKSDIEKLTAPNNWKTRTGLLRQFGVRKEQIDEFLKKYPEHPFAKEFVFPYGNPTIYYNPEIVPLIDEMYQQGAPEGWVKERELATQLNVDFQEIRLIAKTFLEENPSEAKTIKLSRDDVDPYTYYHPDLVEKIKAQVYVDNRNYFIIEKISEELEITPSQILSIVAKLQLSWIVQDIGENKFSLHCSKYNQFKGLIIKEAGWTSINELAKSINLKKSYLRNYIQDLPVKERKSVFYLQDQYESGMNMYLSPSMVSFVSSKIGNLMAPKKWVSTKEIAEEIGGDMKTVRRLINEIGANEKNSKKYLGVDGTWKRHLSPELAKKILEKYKCVENWPDLLQASEQVGGLPAQIRGMAIELSIKENIKGERPLYLTEYNGSIRLNPILIETIKARLNRVNGWQNMREIIINSGQKDSFKINFKPILDTLRKQLPEDSLFEFDKSGEKRPLFSPTFINRFLSAINEISSWETITDLANSLRVSTEAIQQFLKENAKDLSQQTYVCSANQALQIIKVAPTVSKLIKESFTVPKGWESIISLATNLNQSCDSLEEKASHLKSSHPEEIVVRYNTRCEKTTYLSPRAIALLMAEAAEVAPDNQITLEQIAKNLDADIIIIEIIARELGTKITGHPKKYISKEGEIKPHYDRSILPLIEKKLPAPQNWMSYVELSTELEIPPQKIKQLAESLQKDYPSFIRKFYDENRGTYPTYLHPDLIEKIKENIN